MDNRPFKFKKTTIIIISKAISGANNFIECQGDLTIYKSSGTRIIDKAIRIVPEIHNVF